jgi:hypothetical protein
MLVGGHQVVYEGCFQNTNESHIVSRLFNEIDYQLWLQGPLNHLGGERRAAHIAAMLRRILEFFHI